MTLKDITEYLHSIVVISVVIDYVTRFVSGYLPYGEGHLAIDGLAVVGGVWTAAHLMKVIVYTCAAASVIGIAAFVWQTWRVA